MDKNWLPNEHEGIHRRTFLAMMGVAGATFAGLTLAVKRAAAEAIKIKEMKKGEDVFAYIKRIKRTGVGPRQVIDIADIMAKKRLLNGLNRTVFA